MNIPGIDVMEGLEHTNNDEELYNEILNIYYEDSEEILKELKKNYQYTDMKLFITHTHAMKSSSRNIGAVELSEMFKEMEFAGRDNNMQLIEEKFPSCIEALEKLCENLKDYIESGKDAVKDKPDVNFIKKMQSALEDMDTDEFDDLLETALNTPYKSDVLNIFKEIEVAYDDFDFSRMEELLEQLITR